MYFKCTLNIQTVIVRVCYKSTKLELPNKATHGLKAVKSTMCFLTLQHLRSFCFQPVNCTFLNATPYKGNDRLPCQEESQLNFLM